MPQEPMNVSWRVTFLYTVQLFQHKRQNFLNTIASADPSGYDAVGGNGFGNSGVSTLAARFFNTIAAYYRASDCTFDGWQLDHLVSGAWVYVASGGTTVVPTGAAPNLSMMFDVTGKNSNNHVMHNPLYEGAFGTTQKTKSYSALSAVAQGLVDYYYNTGGTAIATDAFGWKRSRGGFYATRWLAMVIDSNEKLRRLRRIK